MCVSASADHIAKGECAPTVRQLLHSKKWKEIYFSKNCIWEIYFPILEICFLQRVFGKYNIKISSGKYIRMKIGKYTYQTDTLFVSVLGEAFFAARSLFATQTLLAVAATCFIIINFTVKIHLHLKTFSFVWWSSPLTRCLSLQVICVCFLLLTIVFLAVEATLIASEALTEVLNSIQPNLPITSEPNPSNSSSLPTSSHHFVVDQSSETYSVV